jgi:ribonuclease P protein component
MPSPGLDSGSKNAVWLGLVVPKRFARHSVTRSLVKRQMRAGMRRHAQHIPAGVWVIRLRAAFDPASYTSAASTGLRAAVRNEVETLLASIHRVQDKGESAS